MKNITAYHKESDIISFRRKTKQNGDWDEELFNEFGQTTYYKKSDGFWSKTTYDEYGNQVTLINSRDTFKVNGEDVTEKDFYKFIKLEKLKNKYKKLEDKIAKLKS